MQEFKFKVSVTIPIEDIDNLLCSAFEGGSNYWATKTAILKKAKGAEYASETPQRGGIISVTDGEGEKTYLLGPNEIRNGLEAMSKLKPGEGGHHFGDILKDETDAITGDVFLQCCLFGEVIYG